MDETNAIAARLGDKFEGKLRFVEALIEDYYDTHRTFHVGDAEARDMHLDGETPADAKTAELSEAQSEPTAIDLLIALHACDTATDDALWFGIQQNASVIVTAPCCHKEVRRQLDPFVARKFKSVTHVAHAESPESSEEDEDDDRLVEGVTQDKRDQRDWSQGPTGMDTSHPLEAMLQHGIFRERAAEMATDSMRALLLEMHGYDCQVFEFIGGEHTAKNVMVAAVKRPRARSAAQVDVRRQRLQALMSLYGVQHQRLAELAGEVTALAPGSLPSPAVSPVTAPRDRPSPRRLMGL